jgi:predicted ATP-grasp superfamily ATP-dependent carboligase
MFKFDFDIPTYAEWKVQLDKLMKEQPEQAKKYQEQVQKFWQEFFEDTLKKKKKLRKEKKKKKKKR